MMPARRLFAVVAAALTVVAGSAVAPVIAAGKDDDAQFQPRLAQLVNQYRANKGLPALTIDNTLAELAREHSGAMAREKRMSHDAFPSRVQRSGYGMCVENVGWNYASPDGFFDAWRASPGHDHNLLDPRVDRVGIGASAGYATLIACGK
jgi:uncharacterized protein YkwD